MMTIPKLAAVLILAVYADAAQPPAQTEKPAAGTSAQSKESGKATSAKKPPRKRVVADLSGFDLLAPSKQPMVVGATRALPRPVALAPRLAKLFSRTPEFAWSYEGGARTFVFRLRNAAHEEVFHADVTGTSFQYSSKGNPQLEDGQTYFWTVEAPSPLGAPLVSAPVGFIVVSAAERESLLKELPDSASEETCETAPARAPVFTKHRLWYEAIAAYSRLTVCQPENAQFFDERGTIYAQLKVTHKLADADFAHADELRSRK